MSMSKCVDNPATSQRGTIQFIKYQTNKSALVLASLSRPASRNAFSFDTYLDLIDLLDQVTNDDSLSGIVLTGTGPYFSSGADLKESNFMELDDDKSSMTNKPPGRFMAAMLKFPKVIAAAVNGPAVGIGVTLLLHCDLVFCLETATFWIPFNRLALVPEFCSSVSLIESMGVAKANELLLLGKKIDAHTAERYNICSRVIMKKDLNPTNTTEEESNNNPFHERSIGIYMCREILHSLLDLPHGHETSMIFVRLIRSRRRERLEKVCNEELCILDERFKRGDVLSAALELSFGKSKL